MTTKRIPLTQGKFAIVDEEDFEILSKYKWCAHKCTTYQKESFVAITNIKIKKGKYRSVAMHRFLMDEPKGLQVDHKNHNTLDNRKENLRVSTVRENQGNTGKRFNNTTGFKGVMFNKKRNHYFAVIRNHGKITYLGSFSSACEAAKAYDNAARSIFGEFSVLNFPQQEVLI